MNVEQVLRQLIQKLIDESPTQKLKTVYVLVTENDQLKERLEQAKNHYSGERLVLIPYNLENSHITGVFIKFNENNQIERAEFINPVSEFHNIPDQLEQYFHEIFPNDYLHVKSCEHVDDQKLSAFLTSKYLLELVKEWGFTKHQSSSMINERISPNIDKSLFSEGNRFNFNDSVLDVESSLYTQTLSIPVKISAIEESFDTINCMNRQMSQSYEELKKQLQETFDDLDIVNEDDLEKRIVEKKQRIDDLTSRGNQDGAKKRKRSLTKLEEIQLLINRVKELENSNISNDVHMLKIEIESAFSERDIQNEEHLKRLIIEKKQRIETLKKDGKLDNVRKREKSLSELEHIQSLVDRWNTMTLSSTETTSEMQQTLEDNFSIDDNIDDSSDQQKISIKIETLRNMHKDFQSIPSCSERFVISLLYHISLQLSDCSTTQNFDHFQSDQLEIEVNKEFENLKERIKIEECLSIENQNSVQELSIHIKNKNWENCLSLLRKIFKEISPLNIHDLFRLIDKVDDAAELIKNKDIIFFLGGTGSGKSTTIHFLTGSKMIATKVGGLNHIAPTNLRNSDLQYVTTSPFARSETRCITPVTVNYKDVGMIRAGNIMLCDTPGFEDTNGPEVDVANGISIVRAIRQCHSVKPVVLVSYKSLGDRFEGLKSLTHLLEG
ncbi:hypothetical protein I4U23_004498 [Adineta vaga]|nr:hypothetical protein I4U23_004498 [Adineta vaga]